MPTKAAAAASSKDTLRSPTRPRSGKERRAPEPEPAPAVKGPAKKVASRVDCGQANKRKAAGEEAERPKKARSDKIGCMKFAPAPQPKQKVQGKDKSDLSESKALAKQKSREATYVESTSALARNTPKKGARPADSDSEEEEEPVVAVPMAPMIDSSVVDELREQLATAEAAAQEQLATAQEQLESAQATAQEQLETAKAAAQEQLASAQTIAQEQLESAQATAEEQLATAQATAQEQLETAKAAAQEQLATAQDDNEKLTARCEALTKQEWDARQKVEAQAAQLEAQAAQLEAQAAELESERAAKSEGETDLETERAAKVAAESELATLREKLARYETDAEAAAATEAGLLDTKARMEASLAARDAELASRDAELAALTERVAKHEELRRKMHETISELKGNIRVFCRVRPQGSGSLVRVPSGQVEPTALELLGPTKDKADGTGTPQRRMDKFKFDRVFAETSSQEDVFREVSQLTQSALDGYKVCIFAYGQTGSGKTHTMAGAAGEARGLVPRTAEQVFRCAADLEVLGWTFEFHASCLEIYNEEIRDLLPSDVGKPAPGKGAASANGKLNLVDDGKLVTVPGLRVAQIDSSAHLEDLLGAAQKVRSSRATNLNEHSSRSHYVFRMTISGRNGKTNEAIDGELNLVDLAGSERVKDSGVEGKAFTEATAINKSLSSLGDVISAMGSKAKHVPYRNSKLTHVLQNALSGSAKTLMFVNVSPQAHLESLSSLRFAQKVTSVEVGPASQHKKKE